MDKFLEYILTNYTLFLGAAIIILLAIIGSYADKTNFGQGKQRDEEEDNLPNDKLLEAEKIEEQNPSAIEKLDNNEELFEEKKSDDKSEILDNAPNNTSQLEDANLDTYKKEPEKEFDQKYEELNEEIDEFLPKKSIIDDELLDEIDNLSLDKTQKVDLNEIPDLDDVELPKIKNLKSIDDDIWKF